VVGRGSHHGQAELSRHGGPLADSTGPFAAPMNQIPKVVFSRKAVLEAAAVASTRALEDPRATERHVAASATTNDKPSGNHEAHDPRLDHQDCPAVTTRSRHWRLGAPHDRRSCRPDHGRRQRHRGGNRPTAAGPSASRDHHRARPRPSRPVRRGTRRTGRPVAAGRRRGRLHRGPRGRRGHRPQVRAAGHRRRQCRVRHPRHPRRRRPRPMARDGPDQRPRPRPTYQGRPPPHCSRHAGGSCSSAASQASSTPRGTSTG
jgi:hypothetical protein